MIKFRFYFNNEKDVEWLNEMSRQGYALTGFCMGFYSFDRCLPGEYVYQIDLAEGMFRVSTDYRQFMAEMGVEIVCLWGMWVFLRRRACEGEFKLYTDVESKLEHYTKIRNLFRAVVCLETVCLFFEIMEAVMGIAAAAIAACLILLLIMAMLREITRLNEMLTELRARMGEPTKKDLCCGGGKVSGFLVAGLLLNAFGQLLKILSELSAVQSISHIVTGVAIVLMLAGIWRTLGRA